MTWEDLAKIAPPDKWIEVYKHYQELLTIQDATAWWAEQFNIANKERNELKEKYTNLRQQIFDLRNKIYSELQTDSNNLPKVVENYVQDLDRLIDGLEIENTTARYPQFTVICKEEKIYKSVDASDNVKFYVRTIYNGKLLQETYIATITEMMVETTSEIIERLKMLICNRISKGGV